MKRSKQAILTVAGAFLLFVLLSVSIQRWIVYPQFQALQALAVQRNAEQLLAAVQRETRILASFLADYAEWDDTWNFVESRDPAYLESNFAQSAFERGNFELVWIVRADGAVIYRAVFDPEQGTLDAAGFENGERILEGHPFLTALSGPPSSGFLPTAQGFALVAVHPILTNMGAGPPRGVLVMGRQMGPAFVDRLVDHVRLPVRLRPEPNPTGRLRPGLPVQRSLASGEVETTVLHNDWFGKPAVTLSIRTPPDITMVGRRALMQSVFAVLGQGLLFLLVGGLLAHRALQRSHRAELARQLEERTTTLRETEQYLKAIMDTVPAGIVIVDAREHLILDANPAALSLMNGRREEVVGHLCHTFICPAEKGRCPITDLGKTCDRAEQQLLRTDGTAIAVLKTVVPTHLRGQDCLLECFVDIREQKATDAKLRQTLADMERINKAMVGREERVLELKREVNALLRELGRVARYRDDALPADGGANT